MLGLGFVCVASESNYFAKSQVKFQVPLGLAKKSAQRIDTWSSFGVISGSLLIGDWFAERDGTEMLCSVSLKAVHPILSIPEILQCELRTSIQ